MPDRERIIRAIGCCISDPDGKRACDKCPYGEAQANGRHCQNLMHNDALALLKEQEAKPMVENELGWNCPSCGMQLIGKTASGYPCDLIDLPEDEPIHFCPKCGQAVKWE